VLYAEAYRSKYGSLPIWRTAVSDRLASWQFNTVGWSDELVASSGSQLLATTPTAALGASFHLHRRDQVFSDVFDPEFSAHSRASADLRCRHRRNDPGLLGTFIDNELYWSSDWRGIDELLTLFLNLPARRSGKVAALSSFQAHCVATKTPNASW
jgi:agarase